jgi:hypothetical protein
MDILAILAELGFTNAAVLDPVKGVTRLMTSKGWTYERFTNEDEITAWAAEHKPELAQ